MGDVERQNTTNGCKRSFIMEKLLLRLDRQTILECEGLSSQTLEGLPEIMVPGKGDDDVQFNPLYAVDPEAPSPGAGNNPSPSNGAIGVHREGVQESSIELSSIVSADPDGRKDGAYEGQLAPAASISGSEQLRTPLSGARPLSAHPGRPLTPEQREMIQQSLSGIRENLAEMGPNGTLRDTETVSGTVHNLRSMLEQMNDQEREIAHILHSRGFPPLPELQLVEVPPGLPEEQEEMYLTRSIMKLEEQLEEIERRLTFDERGQISEDAHLYKPSLAWHPMDDEEDEGLEISEVGAYMQQYRGMSKQQEVKEQEEYEEYRPRVGVSFLGLAMNLLYLCACGFYTYVRIWYSLTPLGKYMVYGIIILVVEWLGMISVIMFTVTLLFRVRPEPESEDSDAYKRNYHIRVLVPCYKESLAIIKQTILAARGAEIPPGCKKTIYLCDDGKDVRKREWILSMDDPHVVYVTGRKRPKGETNGKSNNLNNCLKLIYPKGIAIGYGEVMCLFDADQVCSRSFFLKMLPLIDSGDNVAISLSPQCVYNIKAGQDIFNRSNVQFWEVMLPGYDAIGFISCTGTNMLIRCRALQECGWFPNTTVTEDWELGMWMKKYGWVCRYLQEYLAVGEAPLEVRNAFQQRSRWCKGHFQTFFSRACPATDRKLSVFMRIMYSGTVISYLSSGISVPLFSLVPILAILFGVFPLALNLWTVIGITVFYGSTMIVLYHSTNIRRLMALYFVQVSNYILWWTYLKAATLTPMKIAMGKGFSFKVTNKGSSSGFDFPVRDLFVPTVFTFFSLFAFSMGLANLDVNINAPTALSICWCLWNALPGILLLSYTFFGQGRTMRTLCSTVFVLSFLVSTVAILLIWWLYPRDYDTKELLRKSLQFLDAQRSGAYGNLEKPDWRDDTLMYLPVDVRQSIYDLTGGFYNGGVGGNSKLASTVAFSTTMLSWAVLSFPDSFNKANSMEKALKHINAGAMYLMRSHAYNATDPGQTLFFPNTGNLTTEWKAWEQPEALSARLLEVREKYGIGAERALYPIPSFTAQEANQTRHRLLNGAGVADLAAQMSAALTAASLAISSDRSLQENGRLFLTRGSQLFSLSLQFPGVYTQMPNILWDYKNVYMSSSSYRDDQAWAGAWLYKAMKMSGQVTSGQLSDWLERVNQLYGYAYTEWNDEGLYVTRDRMLRATTILLAIETRIGLYDADAKSFLEKYICANDPIDVTPKDRLIHPKAPTLGDTALLSFLMAQYAEREPDSLSKKDAHVYLCKAMSQLRYMVGDRGNGFVVGFGRNPPKNPQQAASSCGAYPNACNSAERYSVVDNINPLNGALVTGPTTKTDSYKDVRTSEANQVSLDNNAALPGLVAAISDADKFWMECLLDGGIFSKHPLC